MGMTTGGHYLITLNAHIPGEGRDSIMKMRVLTEIRDYREMISYLLTPYTQGAGALMAQRMNVTAQTSLVTTLPQKLPPNRYFR